MYDEILKDIRKQCRLRMNGVTSTSMREKGLNYKLNFGLTIPQIKDLSTKYQAGKGLAETLWKEDTRELKILATLVYPVSNYTTDTANKWVNEIPNQEIREQLCLNLLQKLTFAKELAKEWTSSDDENIRTTGYWLLTRILISKGITNRAVASDIFEYIYTDIVSDNFFLNNAANLALKHIGRQSKDEAVKILSRLSTYKGNSDPVKQEIYDSLDFEFEFYHR
jgi:3-methyladenine DNA glycosylase AlkD